MRQREAQTQTDRHRHRQRQRHNRQRQRHKHRQKGKLRKETVYKFSVELSALLFSPSPQTPPHPTRVFPIAAAARLPFQPEASCTIRTHRTQDKGTPASGSDRATKQQSKSTNKTARRIVVVHRDSAGSTCSRSTGGRGGTGGTPILTALMACTHVRRSSLYYHRGHKW